MMDPGLCRDDDLKGVGSNIVILAQAGTHSRQPPKPVRGTRRWIPACAGMTI